MNLDDVKEAKPLINGHDKLAQKELSRFKRDQDVQQHLHIIFKIGIYVAFFSFLLMFVIRIGHLTIPAGSGWLTNDQIQGIDKLFFSGTIGGVIGSYFKNKLKD